MNENELYSMYRSGTVDETEIVKKLVHDIHERNVDIASLKMQLSHSKLQVQALLSREKSYRSDINQLEFAHSTSEQDNVILQVIDIMVLRTVDNVSNLHKDENKRNGYV